MAKSSVEAYGAEGERKTLLIFPEKLKLVTDKMHPLYDERVHLPIDEGMVTSIIAFGVQQAVRVRKNPENGDIEVVYGRQRVKNSIEANRRLKKSGKMPMPVPCDVSRGDAEELFGISVTENEIRRPDTPLGRAEKARRMLERGHTEAQIGIAMGIGASSVKNLISLLEATAVVKKSVEQGKISADTAYRLAKLEPEEQRTRLDKILTEAPREVKAGGKKSKSGSGKKARAIADGKMPMRSAKEVTAMRANFHGKKAVGMDDRTLATSLLDWVLGEDVDLSFIPGFTAKAG
jgi:ParB family chromosome partitioning protein